MVNITSKPGKKGKRDKIRFIDGIQVSYKDVAEQICKLVDKVGEKKVKKVLDIPPFKHRKKNLKDWSLKETKEIVNVFYKSEDKLYPPSEGKAGRKYLKKFFSRIIFRHNQRKKVNNL